MSADNWAVCPRCHKQYKEPESKYGKVSEEEYIALLSKPKESEAQNMREDWSIGMDETGELHVGYSCACEKCGFSYEFETREQAKLK